MSPAVAVNRTPNPLPFNLLPAALFAFAGSSKYCRQVPEAGLGTGLEEPRLLSGSRERRHDL